MSLQTDNTAVRPFHVNPVPEAELTEMRRRINATKWPERETVARFASQRRAASRRFRHSRATGRQITTSGA